MKINNDYRVRKIAGEVVIVPTGPAAQKFNGLITVNETAQFIWDRVDAGDDEEEIVRKVLKEFDVDEETAKADVYGFIKEARMIGMIED